MRRLSSSGLTRPLRASVDAPGGAPIPSAVEEERAGPDLVPVGLARVEVDGAVARRGIDGQLADEGQRQVGGSGAALDRDVEAAAEVAADRAGGELLASDR